MKKNNRSDFEDIDDFLLDGTSSQKKLESEIYHGSSVHTNAKSPSLQHFSTNPQEIISKQAGPAVQSRN